jgi:uncharacterized membrane protein YgaE (UPF0421/DUF939 family)
VNALTLGRRRLRGRMFPILQTAIAATAAWYLALWLLDQSQPLFAPIAAVVSLGATTGQRGRRVLELVGGVILGILVSDLIVGAIGTGPWQAGVMIVLAMGTAVALGGSELLVAESAVSAMLIATLPGAASGFPPERFLEALVGGAVALVVAGLLFPPDPALHVGRALNGLFADMGRSLGEVSRALADGDAEMAERAQEIARGLDDHLIHVRQELLDVRDTANFAPPRRGARGQIGRVERSLPQIDFAARDVRVLARTAVRYLRAGAPAPEEVTRAIGRLAEAVWELAASYDDDRREESVRRTALDAAAQIGHLAEDARDLRLAELVVQVRSVAVDLVRAVELAGGGAVPPEAPTDELLTA